MDVSQKILSDIVVFNKYAKHIDSIQRRETWDEICHRNMQMHIKKYPSLKKEIRDVYTQYVIPKKVLPSMRSMQFGGTPIELSPSRIYNCAFSNADHPAIFWESMFNLLNGCGVGYSVQTHHVNKLPAVKGPTQKRRKFLVGDSIIGWADAIKVLVKAYFEGKSDPEFDYRDIREKGAKLVTSGGKAPGPDPLRICLDKLRSVLNNARGRHLTSIEVHDMLCHIADAVLAGGIRRAAMISLFSKDDMNMLYSKSGAWWELNPQRGRANNSVILKRGDVTKEEFKNIWKIVQNSGSGEPGFVWTDDLDSGVNPCVSGDTLVDVRIDGIDQCMRVKDFVDLFIMKGNAEIKTMNDNGEVCYQPVFDAARTRINTKVLRVTDSESGKSIICTPDHKIFTQNRGWVEAKDLLADDILKID